MPGPRRLIMGSNIVMHVVLLIYRPVKHPVYVPEADV